MNQKIKNENLNRMSAEEFRSSIKNKIILVLDNVRSLNNVGSVFRTSDAFRIQEIYLCGVTGTPPNKEIEKTALGASETVKWKHFKTTSEALQNLRDLNYIVYSVEQAEHSITLNKFKTEAENIALIFGNEVYGVEQEIINASDGVLEIPQLGSKHSFNIAVSVGIVLWELLGKKIN